MGAWIEISKMTKAMLKSYVAPYMGAWIEIFHPLENLPYAGRTLHGCVD